MWSVKTNPYRARGGLTSTTYRRIIYTESMHCTVSGSAPANPVIIGHVVSNIIARGDLFLIEKGCLRRHLTPTRAHIIYSSCTDHWAEACDLQEKILTLAYLADAIEKEGHSDFSSLKRSHQWVMLVLRSRRVIRVVPGCQHLHDINMRWGEKSCGGQ
jgi:hypothetical protein